jgi:RNA polymerase sigma-70 factor, ECF subfamily
MPPTAPSVADRSDAALQSWITAHIDLAYAIARRVLHHGSDAEDAVQEAFIRFVRSCDDGRSDAEKRSYLVRLTLDACRRQTRASARRRRREAAARIAPHRATIDEPHMEREETALLVDEAVDGLDDTYRVPVILHYYQNLDSREIATALGISQTATTTRLSRALAKLEKILKPRVTMPAAALLAAMRSSPAIESTPALLASMKVSSLKAMPLAAGWPVAVKSAVVAATLVAGSAFSLTLMKGPLPMTPQFSDIVLNWLMIAVCSLVAPKDRLIDRVDIIRASGVEHSLQTLGQAGEMAFYETSESKGGAAAHVEVGKSGEILVTHAKDGKTVSNSIVLDTEAIVCASDGDRSIIVDKKKISLKRFGDIIYIHADGDDATYVVHLKSAPPATP